MKQTKKQNKLFFIIFLATVIPTIYVYGEHAKIEFNAYNETISETKKTKTLAEAIFFFSIAIIYAVLTIVILSAPEYRIPYIIIIVGTIAIVIFYYVSRISSVPIPFTDVVIVDRTADWRDVVTKIAQQIMVVPVSLLLAEKLNNRRL
jgi:hypothetical protein